MNGDWERGFAAGYAEAHRQFGKGGLVKSGLVEYAGSFSDAWIDEDFRKMKKPKRKQSPKQKILTAMTDKKWKSYKRNSPKGKKTYVQIRAQVSRSQAYKRKTKGL